MASYGGWKEYIFAIAAVIYVAGMFPLFYVYDTSPGSTFTLMPTLTIVSIGGAFLLFGQFLVAAWTAPRKSEK
jgi:hypothetical protein